MVESKVPCFFTEGSPSKNASQPEFSEAVAPFWRNTETETRTEHTTSSTTLDVDGGKETRNQFTLQSFLQAKEKYRFCRESADSVGDLQFCFGCDRYKLLFQESKLDGALHRVVPERLCQRLVNLAHYPLLVGHLGETQMHFSPRRE